MKGREKRILFDQKIHTKGGEMKGRKIQFKN